MGDAVLQMAQGRATVLWLLCAASCVTPAFPKAPPSLPASQASCIEKGYPPRGGWTQQGCVCVMPGHKCSDKNADSPFNSEIHCTNGACEGSTCTITCDQDFKLKGCTSPCVRTCGANGHWSATQPKCVPALPGKPRSFNVTAISPTEVMMKWYNTSGEEGDGLGRSWLVYKESTVTHHPFPPEEAAAACFTPPCHFESKNLLPNTTYT